MTSPFQPIPCAADSGGGGDAIDVESVLLCDTLPDGEVVGSALAVYQYDSAGAPVGPPTFVDPATGLPYVAQGTLLPCPGSEASVGEFLLCDVQAADNSSVQFIRKLTQDSSGAVLQVDDIGLDGSPYTPTGTVTDCDPYRLCTPSSDLDLVGDCGPGETPNTVLIGAEGVASDSVVNDDPSADPLCGGVWDRPSEASPFTVNETFRNATFDQPGPVTQGTAPYAGLTADPAFTGSNAGDTPGNGWLQTSDINSFTNGMWQVPNPFSTADGMTARVKFASHDGTGAPNGDGYGFFFTDGAAPPQSSAIGGGGGLGHQNWQGGYVGVILDEYGAFSGANRLNITAIGGAAVPPGTGTSATFNVSTSLAPKDASTGTTRATPGELFVSIINEGGQTYISVAILWPGDTEPIVYYNRFNLTAAGLPTAPPTLRMSLYGGSGGAFRSEHEWRDAVATAAGSQDWRAFPITTDPIPACVTSVRVEACVDVTFTEDTQTVGNANPEAFLWLVNTATSAVLDKAQRSSQPSQVGTANNLCVDAVVPVAQLANLRVYVGAETRDSNGIYGSSWENLEITVAGLGCPVTPVRTLAISAPCPIDVNIIGGTADGTPAPVTVVNTPATFEDAQVCAVVAGVPQRAFRREVRAADGTVTVTFLGDDGVPVTPDLWRPGSCSTPIFTGIVCDITPDVPAQSITQNFTGATDVGTPGVDSFYSLPNGLTVSINAPAPVNGSAIDVPANAQIVINYPAGSTTQSYGVIHFAAPGGQLGHNPNNPTSVSGDATLAGSIVDATIADGSAIVFLPASTGVAVQVNNNDVSLSTISYTLAAVAGQAIPIKQFHTIDDGAHIPSYTGLDGTEYNVAGTLGACPGTCADLVLGEVCISSTDFPGIVLPAVAVQDCTDGSISYLNVNTGVPWTGTTTVVICPPENQTWEEILCDAGAGNEPFRRVYTLTSLGSVVTYDEDLDAAPYLVVGPVATCDVSAAGRDIEQAILCDNNGPFIRTYQYNDQSGLPSGVPSDFTLAGAPYVTAGTVINCASAAGRDVEQEILCDSAGTRFIRVYQYNDQSGLPSGVPSDFTLAGAPFVPVGAVSSCTTAAGRDEELLILCDATPTRFLRRYNFDSSTGALISIVNTTLDGATAFAPVGAVGVCTTAIASDFDFLSTVLCDANGTQFIQRLTFNSATGAVTATTNTTLTGGAFAPVAPVALCTSCCPVVLGEGCTNVGSLRYTALRLANGTISLIDSVTGAAVLPAAIVACQEGCVDCDTVVLADSSAVQVPVSVQVIDSTPWQNYAFAQAPLDHAVAQAIFDGGSGVFPGSSNPGLHTFAVGRVVLDCEPCGDPTNVTISGTVRVRNDGPGQAVNQWGRHSFYNTAAGDPGVGFGGANDVAPDPYPVGLVTTLTYGPAVVTLADLRAGNIVVELSLESNDGLSPGGIFDKSWTVDRFDVTVTAVAAGCGDPFLRTTCRDCDGVVATVTNTTDGTTPFVPVGAVGPLRESPACGGSGGSADTTAALPVTLTAQGRLVIPGSPWTPGTDVVGTLTGITITGQTGTFTVVDQNSTSIGPLAAGASLSWNTEDANGLSGPTSVTAAAASSVLVTWTQR